MLRKVDVVSTQQRQIRGAIDANEFMDKLTVQIWQAIQSRLNDKNVVGDDLKAAIKALFNYHVPGI